LFEKGERESTTKGGGGKIKKRPKKQEKLFLLFHLSSVNLVSWKRQKKAGDQKRGETSSTIEEKVPKIPIYRRGNYEGQKEGKGEPLQTRRV